ncbi:hypothetical protein DEM27_31745 [Metarhizobium album]|uniref:Uncharacterized protein n=1 Tax=Metarhizobium album TaxID=2182425 RepID=A0A2U2DG62_9HYPH|nr:hypothetical protein [Rhizobium album]PWE52315.1 hypothetical protein DEM27_31745 [Rhizobium album]
MALTRLTKELAVNKDLVASVHWDRLYTSTALVVTMQDGTAHRITHTGGYTGGDDCYEIERRLLDA